MALLPALASVAGCLLACASEPTGPSRAVLMGNENRVFMILPLNVAAAMPQELNGLSPVIWKQLELYLRRQGKELKTISRTAARNLWIRSIRTARAADRGAGYDDAARLLALELAKHTDFDVLVTPSLFLREARISNRTARWDGVVRDLEFDIEGLEARTLASSTPLEGVAPAASLHVAVFDAAGEKLHEAQGGLDVLVRVVVRVDRRDPGAVTALAPEPHFEFVTRTDVFTDKTHLREGFDAAFISFLPPLRE
ncbi:MAG: hypothetical protein QNK04_25875 [Myxococcota bacterium]|nr:hypothetical protein [Myxococcota bacterium]